VSNPLSRTWASITLCAGGSCKTLSWIERVLFELLPCKWHADVIDEILSMEGAHLLSSCMQRASLLVLPVSSRNLKQLQIQCVRLRSLAAKGGACVCVDRNEEAARK
jgi:hypothetical protein